MGAGVQFNRSSGKKLFLGAASHPATKYRCFGLSVGSSSQQRTVVCCTQWLAGLSSEDEERASADDGDYAKNWGKGHVVRFLLFGLNGAHVNDFFVRSVGDSAIHESDDAKDNQYNSGYLQSTLHELFIRVRNRGICCTESVVFGDRIFVLLRRELASACVAFNLRRQGAERRPRWHLHAGWRSVSRPETGRSSGLRSEQGWRFWRGEAGRSVYRRRRPSASQSSPGLSGPWGRRNEKLQASYRRSGCHFARVER